MTTAVETFRAELFARLMAGTYGTTIDAESIRRSRKTIVPRERCPAIYLSFPKFEPKSSRSCNWEWRIHYRIMIFVADDGGDESTDGIVNGVLAAINPQAPNSTDTPTYSNGVTLEAPTIQVIEDAGDADPVTVEIAGVAQLAAEAWTLTGQA